MGSSLNSDFAIGSQPIWFPWAARAPRIILSSTCIFRRNLDGILFPPFSGDHAQAARACDEVTQLIGKHPEYHLGEGHSPQDFSLPQRGIFAFNRLASKEYLALNEAHRFFISEDRSLVCRINDLNHLTLQKFAYGLQLDSLVQELNGMLAVLGMDAHFARDQYFGYLCSKPEFCGTGFSAHVFMNLPGIILRQLTENVENAATELGFKIAFDKTKGNFNTHIAIVSACNLPRCSPQEIAVRLNDFVKRLERHELDARQMLLQEPNDLVFRDLASRAFSMLLFAELLQAQETVNALSVIWAAAEMDVIPEIILTSSYFKLLTTTLCQLRLEEQKGRPAPLNIQASRAKAFKRYFGPSNPPPGF